MNTRPLARILPLLVLFLVAQPACADAPLSAQDFLKAARERYRALQTYQDTLTVRTQVRMTDADGEAHDHAKDFQRSFRYAQTNRFALTTLEANLYSDGQTRWTEIIKTGNYTERPVQPGDEPGQDLQRGPVHIQFHPHPVGGLLLRPEAGLFEVYPDVEHLTNLTEETRDGVPGHRLSGALFTPWSSDHALEVDLWFRASDGLLTDIRVNATKAYQAMINQHFENQAEEDADETSTNRPQAEVYLVEFAFRDIVVNAPLADEAFVFKPGTHHLKVARFKRAGGNRSEQMRLIGQPAPAVAGTGLDGQPLHVADLRGRVVVLDFWATWCGPCVAALPQVQKLADHYADRPVTVLGINRDGVDTDEKVTRFLAKKNITFRQFMDYEGTVAEAYKVTGIPCQVLIDTNGVIADISIGFGPDSEEDLIEKIRRVLDGQPVHSAAELAELTADSADEEPSDYDDAPIATNAVLEEVHPDSLTPGERTSGLQVSSHYARTHDVDGDGRAELILPGWKNKLHIISSDGATVTNLNLKGPGSSYSMNGCLPVATSRGVHWLALFTRWSERGEEASSVLVFFAPDGQPLWTYNPATPFELSAKVKMAAGDLDGDGAAEIALGISLYRRQKMDRNSYRHVHQRSYLTVLNLAGQVQSMRDSGLRDLDYVWIASPAAPGQAAPLLVLGSGTLRRYTFSPSAGTAPGATQP